MRAISKKTVKVLDWMSKHPEMSARQVAEKFQIHVSRVYQLRKRLQEDGAPLVMEYDVKEPEKAVDVDAILNERGQNYGTFEDNALTAQRLKLVLRAQEGWYRLSVVQQEAIEMMMHKISRLVNGDPTYVDTVVDISGYNALMLESMKK